MVSRTGAGSAANRGRHRLNPLGGWIVQVQDEERVEGGEKEQQKEDGTENADGDTLELEATKSVV